MCTCRCARFPYLGKGQTDCAEIWYMVKDQLARQFTQTKDGVHLHVQTCPVFHISEMALHVALKLGKWLETH